MKRGRNNFPHELVLDMVRRYRLGQTLNIIALAHDTSPATVSFLIRKAGVVVRRSGKEQWMAGRLFTSRVAG